MYYILQCNVQQNIKQEAQLMPTNPRDALEVSQGHQTL